MKFKRFSNNKNKNNENNERFNSISLIWRSLVTTPFIFYFVINSRIVDLLADKLKLQSLSYIWKYIVILLLS